MRIEYAGKKKHKISKGDADIVGGGVCPKHSPAAQQQPPLFRHHVCTGFHARRAKTSRPDDKDEVTIPAHSQCFPSSGTRQRGREGHEDSVPFRSRMPGGSHAGLADEHSRRLQFTLQLRQSCVECLPSIAVSTVRKAQNATAHTFSEVANKKGEASHTNQRLTHSHAPRSPPSFSALRRLPPPSEALPRQQPQSRPPKEVQQAALLPAAAPTRALSVPVEMITQSHHTVGAGVAAVHI